MSSFERPRGLRVPPRPELLCLIIGSTAQSAQSRSRQVLELSPSPSPGPFQEPRRIAKSFHPEVHHKPGKRTGARPPGSLI